MGEDGRLQAVRNMFTEYHNNYLQTPSSQRLTDKLKHDRWTKSDRRAIGNSPSIWDQPIRVAEPSGWSVIDAS